MGNLPKCELATQTQALELGNLLLSHRVPPQKPWCLITASCAQSFRAVKHSAIQLQPQCVTNRS